MKQNNKNVSLNIDDAIKYGTNAALFLFNIKFWVYFNKKNNKLKSLHKDSNGIERYWTFNSIKEYKEQFPFLSEKQIRYAIDILIKDGVILTGTFNNYKYDRTKWYTLNDNSSIPISTNGYVQKGIIHLPWRANGFALEGEPIPDISPDISQIEREDIENSLTCDVNTEQPAKGIQESNTAQNDKTISFGSKEVTSSLVKEDTIFAKFKENPDKTIQSETITEWERKFLIGLKNVVTLSSKQESIFLSIVDKVASSSKLDNVNQPLIPLKEFNIRMLGNEFVMPEVHYSDAGTKLLDGNITPEEFTDLLAKEESTDEATILNKEENDLLGYDWS